MEMENSWKKCVITSKEQDLGSKVYWLIDE